jgi:hypothetical protein
MLGRSTYTQSELDHAKAAVTEQVAAYDRLVWSVQAVRDPQAASALETFEPLFFNDLVLVLDRFFVHRVRKVAGKDSNPLNEVELLAQSLMDHEGVLRANNVITLVPGESVLGLEPGDRIRLRADEFSRLATAFFAELEARFVA